MPLKRCLTNQQYSIFFVTCGPAIKSSEEFQVWLKKGFEPMRVVTSKEVGETGYPHFHAILKFDKKKRFLDMNRDIKNFINRQAFPMPEQWEVNTDWRHGDYGIKNAEEVMLKYLQNPTKIKEVGDVLELDSAECEIFDELMKKYMYIGTKAEFREMYQLCSAHVKQSRDVQARYRELFDPKRKRTASAYEREKEMLRAQASLRENSSFKDMEVGSSDFIENLQNLLNSGESNP